MKPEEFNVSHNDLEAYLYYTAYGMGIDLSQENTYIFFPDNIEFPVSKTKVRPYPDDKRTAFYIVNYPTDRWEIVSADKRTSQILAAGKGRFDIDSVNANMKGWLKGMAKRIFYLKTYSGPVRDGEERFNSWNSSLEMGYRYKEYFSNSNTERLYKSELQSDAQPLLLPADLSGLTRSGSEPDTSYHPAPGHYELFTYNIYGYSQPCRLTHTTWGGGAPYNQYCPIYSDIPSMHANAGSEAVAGGQMVYYMHYNCELCDEIYSTAFCSAHIGDNPMDWTNMEQFNKSAANWANFQTSDSSRMAAVMLANIGSGMQMNYGLNYSYGDIDALQDVLYNEYGLESFLVSFSDPTVSAFGEIDEILIDHGIPSIVHSDGDGEETLPYTFIVDGYRLGYKYTWGVYIYQYDNPADFQQFGTLSSDSFLISTSTETHYYMNWGFNGNCNDVVFADENNWSFYYGNYTNRECMLSFRMDGSTPWDGNESGGSK